MIRLISLDLALAVRILSIEFLRLIKLQLTLPFRILSTVFLVGAAIIHNILKQSLTEKE